MESSKRWERPSSAMGAGGEGKGGWFSLLSVWEVVVEGEAAWWSVERGWCGSARAAFRGEGNSILRVGFGVRSSTWMGICWVPRKRAGEDWMARWRATAAADSPILFDALPVTACALEARGLPMGGNCGEYAPSGSCGSSS